MAENSPSAAVPILCLTPENVAAGGYLPESNSVSFEGLGRIEREEQQSSVPCVFCVPRLPPVVDAAQTPPAPPCSASHPSSLFPAPAESVPWQTRKAHPPCQ